ncbi:hypothetical protein [Micromonospora cremea]|uniref:hypothetical protein n=1 Tax=Micromonospora cremea TaxID=709881 RepID=UPI00117E72A4|nr:hypothetical protein [Micromonospora cremea]
MLDRLIGDEVAAAEREVDLVRRRLRANGAELRKHLLEQAKRPELERHIAKLTHELELFQQTGARWTSWPRTTACRPSTVP